MVTRRHAEKSIRFSFFSNLQASERKGIDSVTIDNYARLLSGMGQSEAEIDAAIMTLRRETRLDQV